MKVYSACVQVSKGFVGYKEGRRKGIQLFEKVTVCLVDQSYEQYFHILWVIRVGVKKN